MVDSTPYQPIFPPGAFALFPPARAKEGPALSPRTAGECAGNDAACDGPRSAGLAA